MGIFSFLHGNRSFKSLTHEGLKFVLSFFGFSILFIAGRFKIDYTFNLGQHREINIKQNSHFDKDDLENLQRLLARGAVNMEPLILDVVPVSEAKLIYDRLRDQPQELLGTVFDWR